MNPAGASGVPFIPETRSELVTAIAHYYRGEMSRMITWRDRLDRTTNWAIAAAAAMLSVTLSTPGSHHAVLLCCMLLVFLLLGIESRRYRFYDAVRARVRLVERNYYARVMDPSLPEAPEDWRRRLSEDLERPRYTLTIVQAMSIRLRRNYCWIYLTLLLAWWLKVTTIVLDARTGEAEFAHSFGTLLRNARVAYIPGALVIAGVLAFTAWMLIVMTRHAREAEEGAEV